MDDIFEIISISKFKGNTYCVELQNEESIYLNKSIINEFHIKEGAKIPKNALDEIIFENDFRRARERALYLLDVRDYSYMELYHKLEKNYSEELCFKVMDKMVELGCINDRRYAQRLAEYLSTRKKFGFYRAKMEMRKKGLDDELIEEFLEPYKDDSASIAYEVIQKKYMRYLDDDKGIKKTKSALVRLGFSYDDINAAINVILDE